MHCLLSLGPSLLQGSILLNKYKSVPFSHFVKHHEAYLQFTIYNTDDFLLNVTEVP